MPAFHLLTEGFLLPYRILVIALAAAGFIFWRVAFRVLVFLFLLLLVSGAVAFIDGFAHGI
jgi:hypothetical protein